MKLYLSGGGSGRQNLFAYNSFFNSIDKNKPVLYIPFAMDEEKYEKCYNWFKREIVYFGVNNFEMVRSSLELQKINLLNYSSIFIGGGNTYKLLKELQSNSNLEKIKKYLLDGGIVYGGSAGAIIFGKDIDGCALMDDKLEINTRGFNLINGYSLLCHYNKNRLLFLPEEVVLLVTNKKIKFIGEKKYCLFINGDYSIRSSANFKKDIKR